MPPPVRKRRNYATDVSTLNRIQAAVRDDDRIPKEKRERIVAALHRAMSGLMDVDAATIGEDDEGSDAESGETANGEAEEESGPSAAE